MASAATFTQSGAQEDWSGIFQFVFLGYCALICVEQIIPATLVLFGNQSELSF
jgi:hypothetical protein